jgi:hypothetical protein
MVNNCGGSQIDDKCDHDEPVIAYDDVWQANY